MSTQDHWYVLTFGAERPALGRMRLWLSTRCACTTHNPPAADCPRADAPFRPGEVALLLYPGREDPSGIDDAAPRLMEIWRIDTHNANTQTVLDHLAALPWRNPGHVQVLMQTQDSDLYALFVLRKGVLVHVSQPDTSEHTGHGNWTLTLDADNEPGTAPG